MFAVQDDITRSLAVALEPNIRNAEIKRAQQKPTDSLLAYDLYLRALRHVHATTEKDNALALSLLRTALGIDPRFARAAAMAAMRFEYRSVQGWGGPLTREELAEAITLAEGAVQLEPEDPAVLWAAAIIAGRFGHDHKLAADYIERALALNPNSVEAHAFGGWAKCHAGDFPAAEVLFEKALRLSPLDPSRFRSSLGLAATHFAAKRYNDAIAWCHRSITEYRHFSPTFRFLAASAAHLGRSRMARDAVAELLRTSRRLALPLGCL